VKKIASDIKLIFYSSTITVMHGPINIILLNIGACSFGNTRPYHGLGGWSPPAFNRGGTVRSQSGPCWVCDGQSFFSEYFRFPLSLSFHQCSILINFIVGVV